MSTDPLFPDLLRPGVPVEVERATVTDEGIEIVGFLSDGRWLRGMIPPKAHDAFAMSLGPTTVSKDILVSHPRPEETIREAYREASREFWKNWDQTHLRVIRDALPAVEHDLDDPQRPETD